jgi:hypothetical protein
MCLTDLQVIRGMAGERAENQREWRFPSAMRKEGAIGPRGRRRFVAALALAAVVFLVAGCGGGGSSTTTTGAATGAAGASGATAATRSHGNGLPEGRGKVGPTPGTPRDPAQVILKTVERVLASSDPLDACVIFVTPRYVKAAYGNKQGCEQAVKSGNAASSVDVTDIHASKKAGTATVVAMPHGGPNDGEKLELDLVLEKKALPIPGGGERPYETWRIDRIQSSVPVGP